MNLQNSDQLISSFFTPIAIAFIGAVTVSRQLRNARVERYLGHVIQSADDLSDAVDMVLKSISAVHFYSSTTGLSNANEVRRVFGEKIDPLKIVTDVEDSFEMFEMAFRRFRMRAGAPDLRFFADYALVKGRWIRDLVRYIGSEVDPGESEVWAVAASQYVAARDAFQEFVDKLEVHIVQTAAIRSPRKLSRRKRKEMTKRIREYEENMKS